MLKNRKLDHINVKVPNLEEAVELYTTVLGCEIVNRFSNGVKDFVFVSDGTLVYELLEDSTLEDAKFDHMAYVSEDIEADYNYFKNLNKTLGEIGFVDFLFDNGVYFFFIKGSHNERIEFCQKKE